MVEPDDGTSYGLTNAVKRQSIVALVELGVWNRRAVHNRLVVSKHVRFLVNRDTQILQSVSEINGLIHANTSSDELGSVGGSFNSCLLLGVPVDGGIVGKVENASHRPSGDHVMVQVCIHVMSEGDKLAQGRRQVMGKNFLNVAVNGIGPVKLLVRKSGEIRLFSSKANGSMLHLDKVSNDTLNLFKVPFSWGDPEPRHCHDGSGDVDPS